MPIIGLTDRDSAFPEIGSIRKGDKGGTHGAPRDLDYFRVEMDRTEGLAIAKFVEAYGLKPREITVLMPFDDPDRCMETWRECYDAGALIHRCDGKTVQYAIDRANGRRIVSNGLSLETGQPVPCREDHVVYEYTNRKGDHVVAKCGPVMRMRVIIPELRRLAYFVVHSGSTWDIMNLSRQLRSIWEINNQRLAGVPLILKRTEHEISVPRGEGGKKMRTKKWLLSLEADPVWVAKKFGQMRLNAMNMLAIEAPSSSFIDADAPDFSRASSQLQGFQGVTEPADDFDSPSGGDESGVMDDLDAEFRNAKAEEQAEDAAIAASNPYAKSSDDFPLCDWCGDVISAKGIPCPACAALGANPDNNPKGNKPDPKTAVGHQTTKPQAAKPAGAVVPATRFSIKDLCSWKEVLIWGQEQKFYDDLEVNGNSLGGKAPFRVQSVMKSSGIDHCGTDNVQACKDALQAHYNAKGN